MHPKYAFYMNKRKIYYLLHNGKNSNLKYFVRSYIREYTPKIFSQIWLEHELKKLDKRPDKDYILKRVDYYCKLTPEQGRRSIVITNHIM